MALLPDGGVLMEAEGEIKKLTTDGDPDPSFGATTAEVPGQVGDLIQQTDGKVVIKGAFTRVNGVPRRGMARLNEDGSVDPSFVPDEKVPGFFRFDGAVFLGLLRYQPWDGKLVVVGSPSVSSPPRLMRLNPDGTSDVEFVLPEHFSRPTAVVPQVDGTVYVASWEGVLRLKADGAIDPNFHWSGIATALALQDEGKLLVGQSFTNRSPRLIRLKADGILDAGFDSGVDLEVRHILVQPDGKIVVADTSQITRLDADGPRDSSFGRAGDLWVDRIDELALVTGNRLAVFGSISSIGSGKCLFADCASAACVLLNASGLFEGEAFLTANEAGYGYGTALPLADGGFLVAGPAAANSLPYGLELVRVQPSPVIQSSHWNPDGSIGFRIGGRADWTYSLEASTNLVNWTLLRDVPSEGLTTSFRDTAPAGEALRFYRAALKR